MFKTAMGLALLACLWLAPPAALPAGPNGPRAPRAPATIPSGTNRSLPARTNQAITQTSAWEANGTRVVPPEAN